MRFRIPNRQLRGAGRGKDVVKGVGAAAMTAHYTLRNFVRQASRVLLSQYLRDRDIGLGFDIDSLKPRDIDPIIEAMNLLHEECRAGLDKDFTTITSLADQAGTQQILQEADFQAARIEDELRMQDGFLNKSFWTFLHSWPVFEGASRFAMPSLRGRYWKRRLPLAGTRDVDLASKVPVLENALSRYFLHEEGRGKACKIEYHPRPPLHAFHAFPEDFSASPLAWSRAGLGPHPYRPAFEVVFVYNEDASALDIYFEGGKPTIERLWRLFAEQVFSIGQPLQVERPVYSMERLKADNFLRALRLDGAMIDLRVKRLSFAIFGSPGITVAVEADVSRNPEAIRPVLNRVFANGAASDERYPLSQATVVSARIQALLDRGGCKRPRSRTFDLTQKSCSLKYEGDDLLLRRLLLDLGIDGTAPRVEGATRPPA